MLRTVAALVASGVLLAACTQSQVDPEADVSISGRVEDADGGPLADTPVALHTNPGPSILLWTPLIVGTFGAVCATDVCGADHRTQTGSGGRFEFDLRGEDVQGSFGEEVELLAEAAAPGGPEELRGPAGRIRFVVREEQTSLPTVRLWDPPVTIRTDEVSWEAPPEDRAASDDVEVLFQRRDGRPLWRGAATATGVQIDPRILEDTAGGVAGVATSRAGGDGPVDRVELRTGTRRYRSLAGRPASRGGPCTARDRDGTTYPLDPCPVTDGDLVDEADVRLPCPDDAPCPELAEVEIPLRDTAIVELLAVRGCPDCRVELGGTATQISGPFEALSPEVETASVVVSGSLQSLAEVSVWTGPAAGGLEQIAVEAPTEGPDRGHAAESPPSAAGETSGESDGGPPWPLIAVAMLLLGLAGGALVMVRLQRGGG